MNSKNKTDQELFLIGGHLGWGAQIIDTEYAPKDLKEFNLVKKLQEKFLNVSWGADIFPKQSSKECNAPSFVQRMQLIGDFNLELAKTVAKSLHDKQMPVILGGDHAVAVGTWSGVTNELSAQGEFGLIWLDAHMDAHTPETSQSQAIHGMPMASLLGEGDSSLTKILSDKPKLNPKHVVLIGIRSYEPAEIALLTRLGVRYFDMEEVNKVGFESCLHQALDIVNTNTKGFGLSIDLDAFDPIDAPGVGSPEEKGLRKQDVLKALHSIGVNKDFKALEIAEYNSNRDENFKTATLTQEIILSVFGK
jgi:arginase